MFTSRPHSRDPASCESRGGGERGVRSYSKNVCVRTHLFRPRIRILGPYSRTRPLMSAAVVLRRAPASQEKGQGGKIKFIGAHSSTREDIPLTATAALDLHL